MQQLPIVPDSIAASTHGALVTVSHMHLHGVAPRKETLPLALLA